MRSVLLVAHTARRQIAELAARTAADLGAAGFDVRVLGGEQASGPAGRTTLVDPERAAVGAELVLVLGGDGTFLRATELARPAGVPMLGVNLGHVGFLAAAESHALSDTVAAIVNRDYTVEERTTVEAEILDAAGEVCSTAWALNEVSLERTNRERMLEVGVAVDGRPLLRFGCDGVMCATPTGSTAYAFSAGGPIIWPDVDAFLVVPNAAHALFARPIVVAPRSLVELSLPTDGHDGVLSCDGRRSLPVPAGSRVRVHCGAQPIRVARLGSWSFTDRLVSKFQLPVRSLRDAGAPVVELSDDPATG